jgi:hypothetical protein
LKNAETIEIGSTTRGILNFVMPLCENLREIRLAYVSENDSENKTVLTFEPYPLPVKIFVTNPDLSDFIDRFKKVTNISGLVLDRCPSETFMAKYGAVINTLSVYATPSQLNLLSQNENLHLRYLCLWSEYYAEFESQSVQSFLAKQAPFLESFEIGEGGNESLLLNSIGILGNLKRSIFNLP